MLGVFWGISGVLALLSFAIFRLSRVASGIFEIELSGIHWCALGLSVVFFGYTEGYKAFQKQFSPRVVARAWTLLSTNSLVRIILAPAFCMGYFGATRKRIIVSWVLTMGIIGLVLLVGALPQPWRAIVDIGVILALAWGMIAIVSYAVLAMKGHLPQIPTDVPEDDGGVPA